MHKYTSNTGKEIIEYYAQITYSVLLFDIFISFSSFQP